MLFIAVMGSMLLLGGCAPSEPASAQDAEREPAVPVRLAAVDRTPVREPLVVPGLVHPRDTLELGFPSGGVLLEVLVDEGDEVREGQILARLDATAARATLRQAREGLARAERDLDRARTLADGGSLATATFEDAQTGAEVARANVSAAGFAIRYSVLRAPSDGWVDARFADTGEVVGPGQPLVRIASRERGWVARVAVPDRGILRMTEGTSAEVTLDALRDTAIAGRVVEIARVPTPATGTFDVDLALEAPDLTLRTGLVARARIPIGATYTASVPVSALVDGRDREAAVYTVDGDRARRVPVRIAFFVDERAVLADPIEGVERVITAGADRLEDGALVAPSEE
jgi:RND family efflux transporter MFP subunit